MARHALKPRINWLYAAEWLLVIGLAVFAARNLLQMGPDLRVRGQEFSYLIGSGAVADVIYDATGGIPLWNSWMGRGEPLLENSFSYVNNPFMFFPVLAWGMYDGAKIAAVLHAVIAGLGGWLLGYVIGLKTGGRLLAASRPVVEALQADILAPLSRAERIFPSRISSLKRADVLESMSK